MSLGGEVQEADTCKSVGLCVFLCQPVSPVDTCVLHRVPRVDWGPSVCSCLYRYLREAGGGKSDGVWVRASKVAWHECLCVFASVCVPERCISLFTFGHRVVAVVVVVAAAVAGHIYVGVFVLRTRRTRDMCVGSYMSVCHKGTQ